MIVLDTNVVSEAMKPEPHRAVRAWLNNQPAEPIFRARAQPEKNVHGDGHRQDRSETGQKYFTKRFHAGFS